MPDIFLYRRETGINPQQLQKLRREGFIPVGVEFLSDAKFLAAPVSVVIPQARMDLLLVAALKVFSGGSDYTKARFGEAVARTLLASGMSAEGQDAERLGAKPASPVGEAETPKGSDQ